VWDGKKPLGEGSMVKAILAADLDPAFRNELAEKMKSLDFANCLTCGACTAGCVFSDLHPSNDPRKMLRKVILGMREDILKDPFIWYCTMCERCTVECPMGVNIAAVTRTIRGYFRTDSPGFLQKVVDDTLKSGNQMDVQPDEYLETLEWLQEELQAELNDPNYRIPIDVEEADFLFGFNAREVKYYPNELQKILKIFYAAGVNYTLSSQKWDATNLALFSGKDEEFWKITEPMLQEVVRLKARELVITECGHAFRSVRWGYRTFWKGPQFPIRSILEVLDEWIQQGRIKLDPSRNPEPVTLHDPCNLVRKEGIIEPQRRVLKAAVMDFREMFPNGRWNYCCGAGGGALAMPEYTEQRLIKGKRKADQLRATGAKIVAIPCHNCMDQFNDLNKHYQLGMKMEHICSLVERALIFSGEKS
jgi:Fe-S oxidoreductase